MSENVLGLYCVTRPPQDDGVWCRASVNRYLGDDQVSVYCVDYGRSEDVELSRWVGLHSMFAE